MDKWVCSGNSNCPRCSISAHDDYLSHFYSYFLRPDTLKITSMRCLSSAFRLLRISWGIFESARAEAPLDLVSYFDVSLTNL